MGVEGFYSAYRENIAALDETGPFGSVTAGYTHYFGTNWYSALDLRGSYGEVQYSSMSGTIDNIKQWETEDRVLLGRVSPTESGNRLKTYFGLGARYFSDESKGTISSTGAYGYDRRILQFYVPIGVTYEAQSNGFTYAPNLEVDPVFWGNVSSRLANVPGYEDVENHQSSGIGLRGEFMIGQLNDAGAGWQAGPFVRFWYFPDSDTATNSSGTWVEPENTRLQAGAALKLLF